MIVFPYLVLQNAKTNHMALGQNLVALVNINIAGKWVFTPLTLIIIDFDTHPYRHGSLKTAAAAIHGRLSFQFSQVLPLLKGLAIALADRQGHEDHIREGRRHKTLCSICIAYMYMVVY